jgi:hypothetical protein
MHRNNKKGNCQQQQQLAGSRENIKIGIECKYDY